MNQPLFVAGCMRSGTTLLMMLLDSSETIAGPPHESYFMANFYGAQSRAGESGLPEPRDCLPNIARFAHGAYADFCVSERLKERIRGVTTYAEAFDLVSHELAASVGKTRWADKTPGNEFFAKDILELFPGSRIIYMMRDYRDVIASKREKEQDSDDAAAFSWVESRRAAYLWRASMEAHFWNLANLPRDRYATIFYEDLVRKPRETLSSLADFMGEDLGKMISEKDGRTFYQPACAASLYPHRGRSNATSERDAVAQYEISARSVGRYAERLNRLDLMLARRICEPFARVFGYGDEEAVTTWKSFGERERRYAWRLTQKAKFWFGQKGRRLAG